LEKLGFPWILSTESSLFNSLHENFVAVIFVGVRLRFGRFAGLEIVGDAVDFV